jgi:hypothetical protein
MTRREGYWPRHPNKELQAFLLELDDAGWRIKKDGRYYKALCPCDDKHSAVIHLTPSNPYHRNIKRTYLRNTTCFGDYLKEQIR